MNQPTSSEVAEDLRALADTIETHDIAPLLKYPNQPVEDTFFVESEQALKQIGERANVEVALPDDNYPHGRVTVGKATFVWIPDPADVAALRAENAALKEQLAGVAHA